MSSSRVILPDNSERVFASEPTILEVAQNIGTGLAKATVAAKLNGKSQLVDLRDKVPDGSRIEIITLNTPGGNEVLRHSAAHVMAQAVQTLWPDVKVTIGPVIDDGFYYDFDSPRPFTETDLELITKKMEEIIKRNSPITRETWSVTEAITKFAAMGEKYKVEIIKELENSGEKVVTIYRQDDWLDLCRGPHLQTTGQIKAFKLLSVAGAYWRGDEKREQLQRIYATAFADKNELKAHLDRLEEAKKRDHRKLGKEMGLFYFHPLSPGSPFFLPKGTVVYNELQHFIRQLYREFDYQEVLTPQIYDIDLYKISGHYDNYRENMYFTEVDERTLSVKPMNCPGHCLIYASDKKSYRDLPLRIADFGRLHRYERGGVMHGLNRVRTFSQDDAHIFCRMDQMQQEIENFMTMLKRVYHTLGMTEYKVYLSTRPAKRMGSEANWDLAEESLQKALIALGLDYQVNAGDGAFYGPKLDIMFVDALKRPWQLATLQCDFNMPEAFNLTYVGDDNKEHRPVILHRAILGSLERFLGVYIEHCAGHFPTWLCPTQVEIINVTDRVSEYCEALKNSLSEKNVRVHFDNRNEKLNYKIREAQLQRIPYMLIIGDNELNNQTISVRLQDGTVRKDVTWKVLSLVLDQDIIEKKLYSPFLEVDGE